MEFMWNKSLEFFNTTAINDINATLSLHCWVILIIALPLECVAAYKLVTLVKKDHVIPVYVINLLISDIFQLLAKPITLTILPTGMGFELVSFVYQVGLLANIFFMVCIAWDRYTMIAYPLWYRFHRTMTKTIICSLTLWLAAISVISGFSLACLAEFIQFKRIYFNVSVLLLLLPYPFVLFFFFGSCWALSKSISLSTQEQRRIMATLLLVVFMYTALFGPYIVVVVTLANFPTLSTYSSFQGLFLVSSDLLCLNPLFDPILYVLITKKRPCHQCPSSCLHAHSQQGETGV